MKFLFCGGLIMFLGSLFLLPGVLEEYKIEKDGELVEMEIISLPSSCIGAKVRYTVRFKYLDRIYDKQTRGDFCENHTEGDLIKMRFLKGNTTILFPHQSALLGIFSCIGLGIFGLVIITIQWKKLRSL